MITSFNNNEDKICLLLEDNVGGSCVRLRARSHDLGSCDYGITIAFPFGVSFNKQVIVKNYLQLDKKLLTL